MSKIRRESFSLLDTALYLDTHPNCEKALGYYSERQAALKRAVEEYERENAPLTFSNNNADTWRWIESPWPWESESN